jgi:hypothetical protein
MNEKLKEALKVVNEQCKKPDYYEQMKQKSLFQRVSSLKSNFLHYVDNITINYLKTQHEKQQPGCWGDHYVPTELSKREIDNSIAEMEWFIRDIQACINHLKNK